MIYIGTIGIYRRACLNTCLKGRNNMGCAPDMRGSKRYKETPTESVDRNTQRFSDSILIHF